MNILIIEDEKRNFNRLKRLLEEMDTSYCIEGPLTSIAESVKWLQNHSAPDLILADIRLSDGLSFDALRQTAVASPVIFTTAYDDMLYRLRPSTKYAANCPRQPKEKNCANCWNICDGTITATGNVFCCRTVMVMFRYR